MQKILIMSNLCAYSLPLFSYSYCHVVISSSTAS